MAVRGGRGSKAVIMVWGNEFMSGKSVNSQENSY